MKKLLTALSVILFLGSASAQQVTPAKKEITPPVKSVKLQTAKTEASTKPAMAVKPAGTNSALKMKKDGTPDRRFKANQKLKKDGTPDKRFKENN